MRKPNTRNVVCDGSMLTCTCGHYRIEAKGGFHASGFAGKIVSVMGGVTTSTESLVGSALEAVFDLATGEALIKIKQ